MECLNHTDLITRLLPALNSVVIIASRIALFQASHYSFLIVDQSPVVYAFISCFLPISLFYCMHCSFMLLDTIRWFFIS